MNVRDLTAVVAASEYDCDQSELEYKQRKRVYTSLVQTHLPSMANYGIVDYDKDRGTVAPLSPIASFGPYLGDDSGTSRIVTSLLASLTAVFGLLTLLIALDAPVVGSLPAVGVSLAATLGIGALAVTYALGSRAETIDRDDETRPESGRMRSGLAVSKGILLFWR